MNNDRRLDLARSVLEIEIDGVRQVYDRLSGAFVEAVDRLLARTGKIVVIGMGKSGIVGRKLAATLTSTGNPAVFMHPAEGLHGDLGIVQQGDAAIVISNSGSSSEIIDVLEALKRIGVSIIGLTANLDSPLGSIADTVLDISVPREACPMGLAPTASTTAALALGDALAVVLLEESGFTEEEFGHLHPGGALGRRLRRVREVMHQGDDIPAVHMDAPMQDVLVEMTSKRLGIAGILDNDNQLVGIISDGDLRRALEKDPDVLSKTAAQVMTGSPKTIAPDTLTVSALATMERFEITCLFVVDTDRTPIGAIHLHDLLKSRAG